MAADSTMGGNAATQVPELPPEELRRRAAVTKAMAAAFGEIIAIMMRVAPYKHMSLADLEWMVVPAIAAGQFSLAEAQSKTQGLTAPVGVILWAQVSAEIDHKLSSDLEAPLRLKPNEWRSGDRVWIIDAIGDQRVIPAMIGRLRQSEWAGRPVKLRARNADGKTEIRVLPAEAAAMKPA